MDNNKQVLEDSVTVQENKEALLSHTLLDSTSCNSEETHDTTHEKLCIWFADVQNKAAAGKGPKGCAIVDIG